MPSASLPPQDVDAIAADLTETQRGLIVVGRQTNLALAPTLEALAEATGFPILAEPTSQVRLGSHGRSRVIWAYDAIARATPPALSPDLIIRFGDMPTSKALRTWLGSLGEAAQLVVDPSGTWNDPTRVAGLTIRADPATLARELANRIEGAADSAFGEGWRLASEAAERAIREVLSSHDGNPTEPGAHMALGAALRDGDLMFVASSMPIRDSEAFLPAAERDVLVLSNRGANGIDGTVSSAIGASIASGRPAWVVLGDLALHHDSNGLALLRDAQVPIRIVCLNNDGGGIFEFLPQAGQVSREEFEAAFGTPLGLDLAKLATLHGIEHWRVDDLDELAQAATDHHALIEVPVDRQTNVGLHDAIWQATADAIASALDGAPE